MSRPRRYNPAGNRLSRSMRRDYPSGGGGLNVPRTPVERIMLEIRLKRLKLDHLKRCGQ